MTLTLQNRQTIFDYLGTDLTDTPLHNWVAEIIGVHTMDLVYDLMRIGENTPAIFLLKRDLDQVAKSARADWISDTASKLWSTFEADRYSEPQISLFDLPKQWDTSARQELISEMIDLLIDG